MALNREMFRSQKPKVQPMAPAQHATPPKNTAKDLAVTAGSKALESKVITPALEGVLASAAPAATGAAATGAAATGASCS
jgi:hypothetical protein